MNQLNETISAIDNQLSKRHIDLDPGGYFIIYIDREAQLICAKHYTNIINEKGLAVDPETGKVMLAAKSSALPKRFTALELPKSFALKLSSRLNPVRSPCSITLPT
jgi:hypothetical protein